ncbi:MAG TPA: CHASE3 domain-containing protein [Candidatus Binataceae bacterium]|jgi:hypothetical protein|nr:CHASE3 domain-containing protein [Candidatus Binataceae bacterium]
MRFLKVERPLDSETGETRELVRFGSGLVLVVLCLGIGFQFALNRSLSRVGVSMNRAFLVADDADTIVDGLDRLSLAQRFFIRTGDVRFSQDIYESVTLIQGNLNSLRQVARQSSRLRDPISRLDVAVDCALASVRRSNEAEKSRGPDQAVELLDKDDSIAVARDQAQQLRAFAVEGAINHVVNERRMKSILDVLF